MKVIKNIKERVEQTKCRRQLTECLFCCLRRKSEKWHDKFIWWIYPVGKLCAKID